jgi:hypothetical protein
MLNYITVPEVQEDLSNNHNSHHFLSFEDLDKKLKPIEWIWPNWLPRGFLTIIAGESGAGKSALALRLIMSITNGIPWPDGTIPQENGLAVWCETEAAQALNLERAKKWGIDINKIKLPLADATEDISLDNDTHRNLLTSAASLPGVMLLVVDSLSGSSRKDENTTKMLGPIKFLAQLARDKNIAILLIHHLRKKGDKDINSVDLERLRGSSSIVQTARVVWAMDNPNNSTGYQRLRGIKSNLGKLAPAIGYIIDDSGISFGSLPNPEQTDKKSAKGDALTLLRRMLAAGSCDAQAILAEAKENGIAERTLNTAKAELGVRSEKEGGPNGKWVWRLD